MNCGDKYTQEEDKACNMMCKNVSRFIQQNKYSKEEAIYGEERKLALKWK